MRQPGHHPGQIRHHFARRQVWPVNQNDWQPKAARGQQLGLGTASTRVLGNDMADAMLCQQRAIAFWRERPARHKNSAIGQDLRVRGLRSRGIDQSQQVMVLRFCGKTCQVLLANRQKHPRRGVGQGGTGSLHIGHRQPIVTRSRMPWRALITQQRHARFGTGGNRIAAHSCSTRMGGIDKMGDGLGLQIADQSRHAAKSANACGQWLCYGGFGSSGIRKHRVDPSLGQGAGEQAGFGGAAKQKDARHA